MTLIVGLGLLSASVLNVFGEEGSFSQKGLGFTAGALSGIGLAYRQHFQNRWGFQIGGGAWGDQGGFEYHTGLEALRTFDRTKITRFYGQGGVGVEGSREGYEGFWYDTTHIPQYYSTQWNSTVLYLGIGIGMEIGEPIKGIGAALEFPFLYKREWFQSWENEKLVDKGSGWEVIPIPSASVVYYF